MHINLAACRSMRIFGFTQVLWVGGWRIDGFAAFALRSARRTPDKRLVVLPTEYCDPTDEMNLRRHFSSSPASTIVALLVAVLALTRALMPSGYMLDRAEEDGQLVVHMCGAVAARSIIVDLRTGAISENSEQTDTNVPSNTTRNASGELSCPFALAAVANLPTVSVPAGPAVRKNLRATQHVSLAHPVSWLSRPPLPGRGPPNVA